MVAYLREEDDMQPMLIRASLPPLSIIIITLLACNLPAGAITQAPATETEPPVAIQVEMSSPTVSIIHVVMPDTPGAGKVVYDVESNCTALERRAPYGDSYDINRLERPFLQDMTYVSDLDILSFNVASDSDWWYVSLDLIGSNPNNALGINYGIELDLDHDGFGDYLIWAHPPYGPDWDTTPVQVFEDKNHNTGGLSGAKSDAPISSDGYETLIFNGGAGDSDPDLAWVRANTGSEAALQFAFKKSWSGVVFMLGTLADAALKNNGQLDYVDRFVEAEAGSPIKDKQYYPLNALYAVDNTCREAFGFKPTGYEPQLCPKAVSPTREPREDAPPEPGVPPPAGCPDPGNCPCGWSGEPWCMCIVC